MRPAFDWRVDVHTSHVMVSFCFLLALRSRLSNTLQGIFSATAYKRDDAVCFAQKHDTKGSTQEYERDHLCQKASGCILAVHANFLMAEFASLSGFATHGTERIELSRTACSPGGHHSIRAKHTLILFQERADMNISASCLVKPLHSTITYHSLLETV